MNFHSKDGNEILIANTKENDGDGITHINISILGNNELGKATRLILVP